MRSFIIRVDAGKKLGFGHAIRSLSLAKHLRDIHRINTIFYSRPNNKLEEMYRKWDFEYVIDAASEETEILERIKAENSCGVIFIDRLYPFDRETIRRLKRDLKIIMFHNECEGMYESDYAIFPSAHLSDDLINCGEWPRAKAIFLHGPEYVLINETVANFSKLKKEEANRYICITAGASDPSGLLIQALKWINESDMNEKVIALTGFDFCHKAALKALIPHLKSTIRVKKFNYEDLLSSYIAVSTVGVTTYELIFANIPMITIGHIKKNADAGEILERRYGCNYHLGLIEHVTKEQFISSIRCLLESDNIFSTIRQNQINLIDGKGIERIAKIISDFCLS